MLIWITGLSGSGKTTMANKVYEVIKKKYKNTVILDGDVFNEALGGDYGYSNEGRFKSAKSIAGLCRMLSDEDLIVICATMSLFHEVQKLNRDNIDKYIEVYLHTELEELIKRDPKGLYGKALSKEINNVVGIDLSYEKPINPDIKLDTNKLDNLDSNIKILLNFIQKQLKL